MGRFNYNFYLDIRKPLKSGLYSIKVNLYDAATKETMNFTIKKVDGIQVACSKKDYKDIWENKDKENSFGEVVGETTVHGHKRTLRTILKLKQDVLNDILEFDNIRSCADVKREFYDYTPPSKFTDEVLAEFDKKINELVRLERFKTADTYNTTKGNVIRHILGLRAGFVLEKEHTKKAKDKGLKFSDITPFWLEQFERSRKKDGINTASIALCMRNIRSIYNRAAKKDSYLKDNYPFGTKEQGKYVIKEGTARNQGLSKDDLKRIKEFKSDNPRLIYARDLFLFAYFIGGFNYKDLILLTKQDIDRGYFVRKKSEFTAKKEVHVPIVLNELQREILSKYEGKGKYAFDILKDNATAKDIYKEQMNGNKRLNSQYKNLAVRLGLSKEELSWNVARHSFASNAVLAGGVSDKAISEAMGHTNTKTTQNYIKSLFKEQSDELNKALNLDDDDDE